MIMRKVTKETTHQEDSPAIPISGFLGQFTRLFRARTEPAQ